MSGLGGLQMPGLGGLQMSGLSERQVEATVAVPVTGAGQEINL
jgi:hypothetical protein